jgi:hypothetical protein
MATGGVDKVFARLTANRQRHEGHRVQVERELDGVQQKLDRLINALTDDSLPADEIKSRLNLEKARKAALIAELKELQQAHRSGLNRHPAAEAPPHGARE